MPRTIGVTVYELAELPEKIQERIITSWRDGDEYPFTMDYNDSLNQFAQAVGIKITDWNVSPWGHSYVRWEEAHDGHEDGIDRPWDPSEFDLDTGGDCPFTGFCGDEALLDGVRKAEAKPGMTFREVVDYGLARWREEFAQDMEWWHSEECIKEDIEANCQEFTITGQCPPPESQHVAGMLKICDRLYGDARPPETIQ